jgi:hypothetical protein
MLTRRGFFGRLGGALAAAAALPFGRQQPITPGLHDGVIRPTAIPVGDPAVVARKIYRSKAGDSTYKLITTIRDNATSWTDDGVKWHYETFIADRD